MNDANQGAQTVTLAPGHPEYIFPKEVHNLIALANATNITVSGMADTKASILMGASFVVFSMSIADLAAGKADLPLLVLTIFSFVATVFGVLTVRPIRMSDKPIPVEEANILFFGSYTNAPRDAYVEEVIRVMTSEEETYRRLIKDLYDHGLVLRDEKYRWLYWSFTAFLIGMLLTASAVVWQMMR